MARLDELFSRLWVQYKQLTPQAERIHAALEAEGERVVNDHIALRTVNLETCDIPVLAAPFVAAGYEEKGRYHFATKKLDACHFAHPDPMRPLVFISALRLQELSEAAGATLRSLLGACALAERAPEARVTAGRMWPVSQAQYLQLQTESEYAAWLSAFGFCANHFTISVNALQRFTSLPALNDFVRRLGLPLNDSGGVIKGSAAQGLEQSSTLADRIDVHFTDGVRAVPSCYYEFAKRYPQADGTLFRGFIEASADRIFESTDAQVRS
ncbi:MAG: DUF1338 domain-containing protein [Polyangiales bacterium]